MSDENYDLIVIGAGSGGVRAARIAAGYGAKVLIAENFRIGGTCVIRGCVPKKLYVLASRFHDEFEDAFSFGWEIGQTSFNWQKLVSAKEKEISRLSALYSQTLANAGVNVIEGHAKLEGPNEVIFSNKTRARAKHILIATGGAPNAGLNIPGIEFALSSNEIFDLPEFPKRLLIIGAGYVAVEFASVFVRLGARVNLSYRGDLPLRGFDENLRKLSQESLEQAGIALHAGLLPTDITRIGNSHSVTMSNGETLDVDAILIATGRKPATQNLGLEEAGVQTQENGAIIVNQYAQTNIPSVYAVGDVTNRINLTPVAIREGHAFADRVFGGKKNSVNYDCVASAVFTTPEIGTIGVTETQAREKFSQIDVFETSFRPMRATLSDRIEKVYMKLIVETTTQKVIGAHIFGSEAAEMVQLVAIALQMGATKQDFDATMAVHPTMAEELVTMLTPTRHHRRN